MGIYNVGQKGEIIVYYYYYYTLIIKTLDDKRTAPEKQSNLE